MKNVKKIGIVVLMLALFGAYAWYEIAGKVQLTGTLLLDNPTGKKIAVIIDSKNYTLEPYTSTALQLDKNSQHTISCEASAVSNEQFRIDDIPYGVINPTKSKYIRYNFVYSRNPEDQKFVSYTIAGKEIFCAGGEPQVYQDLFIPDLTLGKGNIDNDVPSSQDLDRFNTDDQRVLMKLFREKDFWEYYNTHQ